MGVMEGVEQRAGAVISFLLSEVAESAVRQSLLDPACVPYLLECP